MKHKDALESHNNKRRITMKKTKVFSILMLVVFVSLTLVFIPGCKEKKEEQKIIKIGAILPLTGPGAIFAEYIKDGLLFARDDFNKKSNIKLDIIIEDSKNQPQIGIQVYNKLVQGDKIPAVIVALSSVAKALAPFAKDTKTVQVGIAVAIPGITSASEYVFRIYPEATGMTGVMANFISKDLKLKTAGVIFLNDDFGQSSNAVFKEIFENNGGKVVFSNSYEFNQQSYREEILKLKKADPECVYVSGYGLAYGSIIKQLKELEVRSLITADMTLGLPVTLNQVGNAAEDAYFVDGDMSEEFIKDFKIKYNKVPTSYAGYAYDIVMILGSIVQQSDKIDSEIIKNKLMGISDFPGAMGKIKILPTRDSNIQFVVKKIKDGIPEIVKKGDSFVK